MPWKEHSPMDQRTEFALKALRQEQPFTDLCGDYGISRKTGYKWLERYNAQGHGGMKDRSRRPHHHPDACTEAEVCCLVALKLRYKWGPTKIHNLYHRQLAAGDRELSLSTVKRVLDRSGLVQRRKRRTPSSAGSLRYGGPVESPNDLWTIDFKGWWYTVNGGKFEPLTVCDYASRYILCSRRLPSTRHDSVRAEFEQLFETYGMPRAIRMDNGSPWVNWKSPLGLTQLSSWWVTLGIGLDRIAPGRPDQNGTHERMHRDLAWAVERERQVDIETQQAALDLWREEFNEQRPHEALKMAFPAERYERSAQPYDPTPVDLVYPGMSRRKVKKTGQISYGRQDVLISRVFAGRHVGLQSTASDRIAVWFGGLYIGDIDIDVGVFTARRDVRQDAYRRPPRKQGPG